VRTKESSLKKMEGIEHQTDIPHFLVWLRSKRKLTQKELAELTGLSISQVVHIEKSRQVFPYKTLKLVYSILKEDERVFLLECIKGHVETLLESCDDDSFRDQVKVKKIY